MTEEAHYLNEHERQSRYNRRKIMVAMLFSLPYILWAMFAADKHSLSGYLGPLAFVLYVVPSYFAANALLRWLAKRWP